ncbi:Papain inhibitor [Paramyrothecium foliicola]|nr:Papain inhibitor [Paramyrothecium foliicola]
MLFFSTLVTLPVLALAAAVTQPASNTGDLTYYNTGLGACGETNKDTDFVAAVSPTIFDSKNACNKMIRVSYNGRSADVRIVDLCPGCDTYDVDLTPAAFQQAVGDLGLGRVQGTWDYI